MKEIIQKEQLKLKFTALFREKNYILSLNITAKTVNNIPQHTKRAFSARSSEKKEPVIAPIIKKIISP